MAKRQSIATLPQWMIGTSPRVARQHFKAAEMSDRVGDKAVLHMDRDCPTCVRAGGTMFEALDDVCPTGRDLYLAWTSLTTS